MKNYRLEIEGRARGIVEKLQDSIVIKVSFPVYNSITNETRAVGNIISGDIRANIDRDMRQNIINFIKK